MARPARFWNLTFCPLTFYPLTFCPLTISPLTFCPLPFIRWPFFRWRFFRTPCTWMGTVWCAITRQYIDRYSSANREHKFMRQQATRISRALLRVYQEYRQTQTVLYLNGRKPPTTQCANAERYQGMMGISRAIFLVLHGASKPLAQFLPKIPPMTVNG